MLGPTLGLLLLSAAGQQPDSGVVIRSTTSLVQVRVVAEDGSGKPVHNLQRDDFRILDEGKTQPITLFLPDQPGPSSTGTPTSDPGYAMILLDWLNSKYTDRLEARDQVIRFIRNSPPRQKLGLYVLGRNPRLVLNFSSEADEMLDVLDSLSLDPEDLGSEQIGRFDARFGGRRGNSPGLEEQLLLLNNRVLDTLKTLDNIADRFARVRGRKSLIWISSAFPLVVNGSVVPGARPAELVFGREVDRTMARLNRADVTVYAVDPSGLATVSRSFHGTLQEFASRTGGTAFLDRNDLDEGIRMALEDAGGGYMLGFHVPPRAALGQHEIRVQVARPGVRLRYRESYELADRP